jgi:hypothetical protein
VKHARHLQQLVDRRLKELGDHRGPMPTRRAAARSEGKISYETLRLLKLGRHSGSITLETAEGLSLALDLPLEAILEVAGQRIPQGPFELPRRADTLTKSERAVVLSVIDAILDAAEQERPGAEAPVQAVARSGRRPGGSAAGAKRASTTARRVRAGDEPQR